MSNFTKTNNTLYGLTTSFLNVCKIKKKKFSRNTFLYSYFSKIIDIKYDTKILIKGLLNFFITAKQKNVMLMLFYQNAKINKLLMLFKKPLYIFFLTKKVNYFRYSFLVNFLTKIYTGNFVLLFKYHLNMSEKFFGIKLLMLNNLLYTNTHELEIFSFFQQESEHFNGFSFIKKTLWVYLLNNFKCSTFFFLRFKKFLYENIFSSLCKANLKQFTNLYTFFHLKCKLNLDFFKYKHKKVEKKLILKENLIIISQKKNFSVKKMIDLQTFVLYFLKIYRSNFSFILNILFILKNNFFYLNLYLTNNLNVFFFYFS
nr:hypothetical protein CparaKRNrm1_p091 [Cryptomonas paramecium]